MTESDLVPVFDGHNDTLLRLYQSKDTAIMGNRFEALEVGMQIQGSHWRPVSADVGNSFEAVNTDREGF